jgi:hypothetical protein
MSLHIPEDYLIGFIDAEGCFYIGVVPSKETKNKWQIIAFFKVSQNPSGKVILDKMKQYFDTGYVKPNDTIVSSDKSLAYVVRSIKDLMHHVIPKLEGKLVVKRKVFLQFKKVVTMMYERKHLEKKTFKEIIDIAYAMNTQKRKIKKEDILSSL